MIDRDKVGLWWVHRFGGSKSAFGGEMDICRVRRRAPAVRPQPAKAYRGSLIARLCLSKAKLPIEFPFVLPKASMVWNLWREPKRS
jgi:hypothetical protein